MGSDDKKYAGYVLYRPTATETALLSGRKGTDFASFFRDLQNSGGVVNPNHYTYWRRTTDEFREAISWDKTKYTKDPVFEGGVLKQGSVHYARSIGTVTEDLKEHQFLAMNFQSACTDHTGFFSAVMSSPVKWRMDHIQKRMGERGAVPLKVDSDIFHLHNAVALSMLRIFEEMNDDAPIKYRPFALPHRDGLFLGHTIMAETDIRNRIALIAPTGNNQPNTKPYEWHPDMYMTLRTYIGPQEMTRDQLQLKRTLSKFYGGERAKGLLVELDLIDNITSSPSLRQHPEAGNYGVAYLELEAIMRSSIWDKGVKMPEDFVPTYLKPDWKP